MDRARRDGMPKLVQPGRRRDKWEDEQRAKVVEAHPGTSRKYRRAMSARARSGKPAA
jgi:hypothetical protein